MLQQQQQLEVETTLYSIWHKFFLWRNRRGIVYPAFRGSPAPVDERVPTCSWEFLELCTVGELAFVSVPVNLVLVVIGGAFAVGSLCGCICCWWCRPRRRKAAAPIALGKKDGDSRAGGAARDLGARERPVPRLRRGRGTLA